MKFAVIGIVLVFLLGMHFYLTGTVIILFLLWVLHGAIWPHTACTMCGGHKGFDAPGSVRAWRHCFMCGGSGERERTSHQVWKWLTK